MIDIGIHQEGKRALMGAFSHSARTAPVITVSHILTSALVPGRTGHIHTMLPKWSTATVIFYTQPAYLGLNSISERAPPIELIGMASVKWVTRYGK